MRWFVYCFLTSEKRLNLRQRKCERLIPWEPGEEQHIFLCTSKWWWGAEITYVSPGFPTSEIWNIRLRGRFNFFRALKCWAKFFFMKLRINLMTAQVLKIAVNTLRYLYKKRTDSALRYFLQNLRSWWMRQSPHVKWEARRKGGSSKLARVAMISAVTAHPHPGKTSAWKADPHVGFPGKWWHHRARKLKTNVKS